jgi:hypothetical protein
MAIVGDTPNPGFTLPPDEHRCAWIYPDDHDDESKRGTRCTNWKVKGETKTCCAAHGGNNPGRPIIHGRYSKDPMNLLERMVAAENDPDLQTQNKNLRILSALRDRKLDELLEATPQLETWDQVCKVFGKLEKAMEAGNIDGMVAHTAKLKVLLAGGQLVAHTERDLRQIIQEHKSVAETADKRQIALLQMIPARKLAEIIVGIGRLLRMELVDNGVVPNGQSILARIQGGIRDLVSRAASERTRT